jgi:hypothetical protein
MNVGVRRKGLCEHGRQKYGMQGVRRINVVSMAGWKHLQGVQEGIHVSMALTCTARSVGQHFVNIVNRRIASWESGRAVYVHMVGAEDKSGVQEMCCEHSRSLQTGDSIYVSMVA